VIPETRQELTKWRGLQQQMPKRGVKLWRPDYTSGLCPAPCFCINHMESEYQWLTDHTNNCILYIFTVFVKYCFPVKILQRISFWNLQHWDVIKWAVIFYMNIQNAIICVGCEDEIHCRKISIIHKLYKYSRPIIIVAGFSFSCLLSLFSNVVSQNLQHVDILKYCIRVIGNGMLLVAIIVIIAQEDQKILVNGTNTWINVHVCTI
jgi:hypothetical protein